MESRSQQLSRWFIPYNTKRAESVGLRSLRYSFGCHYLLGFRNPRQFYRCAAGNRIRANGWAGRKFGGKMVQGDGGWNSPDMMTKQYAQIPAEDRIILANETETKFYRKTGRKNNGVEQSC